MDEITLPSGSGPCLDGLFVCGLRVGPLSGSRFSQLWGGGGRVVSCIPSTPPDHPCVSNILSRFTLVIGQ